MTANETEASASVGSQWEYKSADAAAGGDGVFGPFAGMQMASWKAQGYFAGANAVLVRKVRTAGVESGSASAAASSAAADLAADFDDSDDDADGDGTAAGAGAAKVEEGKAADAEAEQVNQDEWQEAATADFFGDIFDHLQAL